MDIKGLGNTGITNFPFSSKTVDNKKGNGLSSAVGFRSTVGNINSNYKVEDRLFQSINDLQGLQTRLTDLQNTSLLSDSNALSAYEFNFSSLSYESNFSFTNEDDINEGKYSIQVQSISSSYTVASDDLLSSKKLGLEGRIEINGTSVSIELDDTINDIRTKLNYGEDLNSNFELDDGEDTNRDGKLMDENDLQSRSFKQNGRLYIESKVEGSESSLNFEGSSSEILQTLGFINENDEVKNLIAQGKDAEILINGKQYQSNDEVEFDGIKMSLDNLSKGNEIEFTVAYNEEKIVSAVEEFAEKYNAVIDYINNELDTNDREILSIKENLLIDGNREVGINVEQNNFYQSMFDLRAALGNPINTSLENAGFIQDDSGKINLNLETIYANINELSNYLDNEVIGNLNESLNSYLNDVNIISIKQEASVKTLSEINKSFRSERVMNQIVIGNQDSMDFLKQTIELFNINTMLSTMDENFDFNSKEEESLFFSNDAKDEDNDNFLNKSANLDFFG